MSEKIALTSEEQTISKHKRDPILHSTYQSIEQSGFSVGSRYEHEPENNTKQHQTIFYINNYIHDSVKT